MATFKDKLITKVNKALDANRKELERSCSSNEAKDIQIEIDMYEIFLRMIKGTRDTK